VGFDVLARSEFVDEPQFGRLVAEVDARLGVADGRLVEFSPLCNRLDELVVIVVDESLKVGPFVGFELLQRRSGVLELPAASRS